MYVIIMHEWGNLTVFLGLSMYITFHGSPHLVYFKVKVWNVILSFKGVTIALSIPFFPLLAHTVLFCFPSLLITATALHNFKMHQILTWFPQWDLTKTCWALAWPQARMNSPFVIRPSVCWMMKQQVHWKQWHNNHCVCLFGCHGICVCFHMLFVLFLAFTFHSSPVHHVLSFHHGHCVLQVSWNTESAFASFLCFVHSNFCCCCLFIVVPLPQQNGWHCPNPPHCNPSFPSNHIFPNSAKTAFPSVNENFRQWKQLWQKPKTHSWFSCVSYAAILHYHCFPPEHWSNFDMTTQSWMTVQENEMIDTPLTKVNAPTKKTK